jgi:Cdc6-like AAA superfamily ATPase
LRAEFVKEAIAPTATDQFSEYRRIGQSIIKSMVVSDKSLLIASGTGTGKSTTEQYFLQQFVSRYPQSEIYALLNKNDDLFGVRRDRLVVFSPEALLDMPSDKEARTALLETTLSPSNRL